MSVEDKYERLAIKTAEFMGKTSEAIENIESNNKLHIEDEEKIINVLKKDMKGIKDDTTAIHLRLSKAIICPHEDELDGVTDELKLCGKERGKLLGERKYIYGGLTAIFIGLGIIIKIVMSLKVVEVVAK